jgi:hypothetical protein
MLMLFASVLVRQRRCMWGVKVGIVEVMNQH